MNISDFFYFNRSEQKNSILILNFFLIQLKMILNESIKNDSNTVFQNKFSFTYLFGLFFLMRIDMLFLNELLIRNKINKYELLRFFLTFV
jgi:hypothetical protein